MIDEQHNRVAIVAGVGPGLGAALVRKLAVEGCRVGMFARSSTFIRKLAAELGSESLAVPTDISDPKQVAAGFREVREKLGLVEILIAHASGSLGGHLQKTSLAQFERSWRTAAFGSFLCAREAVPDMLKTTRERSVRPTGLLLKFPSSSPMRSPTPIGISSSNPAVHGAWKSICARTKRPFSNDAISSGKFSHLWLPPLLATA